MDDHTDTPRTQFQTMTDGQLAAELARRGYQLHYRPRHRHWQAIRRDAGGAPNDVPTGRANTLRDALLQALRRTRPAE